MSFCNTSIFDKEISNFDIIDEMFDHPTLEEIQETIKGVNAVKAPGLDGIQFCFKGNKLATEIHCMI